jgi:hypothetical protein
MRQERTVLAAALMAVVAAATPRAAMADVSVSNLRVGVDAAVSDTMAAVPVGVRAVYARFDYRSAAGERATLDVTAYGGVLVFSSGERLAGTGSLATRISGEEMLAGLTAELTAAVQNARSNARNAATRELGTEEYLNSVQAGLVRLDSALTVLAAVSPSPVSSADVASLKRLGAQLTDLVVRAQRAPAGQQRKDLAARMEPLFVQAADISSRIGASAAAFGGLVPLPASGSAWQYVVRVAVDGSPADSVEFIVAGSRVLLPSVSRHAEVAD